MKQKKILFVIPGLDAGGAEKSLVNLLNTIDKSRYAVDLFLFSQSGLFLTQVPEYVNLAPRNEDIQIFQKPLPQAILGFLKKGKFRKAIQRFRFFLMNKFEKNTALAEQHSWQFIKDSFQTLETEYDAAIGFLEKSSIYFIVDKVMAKKKIGVIHTVFSKLKADVKFEQKYFVNLHQIAVVSEECAVDLKEVFPQFQSKIKVLPNIVSEKLVKQLANKIKLSLEENAIVSVGRLEKVKGFDLAIETGFILKQKNIHFHWYILGEGSERQNLEQMIAERGLRNEMTLVGLKENPYPYLNEASVVVQPSRYEGKSIVIDEAKILAKPIVLTNFTTAKDQIENGVNGLICDMNPEAIAASILRFRNDNGFSQKIIANLQNETQNTERNVQTFYNLIDG